MAEAAMAEVCALGGKPSDIDIWRQVSLDIYLQFRALETRGLEPGGPAEAGDLAAAAPKTVRRTPGFPTVRERFRAAYCRVLPRFGLGSINPAKAAAIVVAAHARAPLYPDALPFLARAAERLPLCLASDADDAFLDQAVAGAGLKRLFFTKVTSQGVRAYKSEPGGVFFEAVAAALGKPPEAIAHVGDGQSDVVGAKRAGMLAVWINRDGRLWSRTDYSPDLTVAGLADLGGLLGLAAAVS
jgi:FMN phosphatase YigB (HAD superfamily)